VVEDHGKSLLEKAKLAKIVGMDLRIPSSDMAEFVSLCEFYEKFDEHLRTRPEKVEGIRSALAGMYFFLGVTVGLGCSFLIILPLDQLLKVFSQ